MYGFVTIFCKFSMIPFILSCSLLAPISVINKAWLISKIHAKVICLFISWWYTFFLLSVCQMILLKDG